VPEVAPELLPAELELPEVPLWPPFDEALLPVSGQSALEPSVLLVPELLFSELLPPLELEPELLLPSPCELLPFELPPCV
jgi:hypothetical protein